MHESQWLICFGLKLKKIYNFVFQRQKLYCNMEEATSLWARLRYLLSLFLKYNNNWSFQHFIDFSNGYTFFTVQFIVFSRSLRQTNRLEAFQIKTVSDLYLSNRKSNFLIIYNFLLKVGEKNFKNTTPLLTCKFLMHFYWEVALGSGSH